MVTASELTVGMAIRIDRQIYRVIQVEFRAGAAKMEGTVRANLANVHTGSVWDQDFPFLEKLEDVELEECELEFLYSDGNSYIFRRLDSFEQVEFPSAGLGLAEQLLQPGTEVLAEFFEGEPISVVLPDTVEARVTSTLTNARSKDSGRMKSTLENGMTIEVPLFVAPGEIVSVDLRSGRYVERVRTQHRKGV
jgi:elongation factor P